MKDNSVKVIFSFEQDARILTLIFITLKLCGVIDWAWWWVLCPVPILVLCLIVSGVVVGVAKGVKK